MEPERRGAPGFTGRGTPTLSRLCAAWGSAWSRFPSAQYFTEQPYGVVAGWLTGLPAMASVSACAT